MVNHPNRKPVSHDDMVESHTSFYPITRSFKLKALQPQAQVKIAGGISVVPLWFCVEWDSARAMVGYHWQPPVGGLRDRKGLESWFKVAPLVTNSLGTHTQREYTHLELVDWSLQDHNFVLKLGRECQEILNSAGDPASIKKLVGERLTIGNQATQTCSS